MKDKKDLSQNCDKDRDYESTGLTPEEIMDDKILTKWIPV